MVAEVMRSWLRSLADAIAGKVPGKPDRLDTATRMAMDADFSRSGKGATPAREPVRKVDQLERDDLGLNRIGIPESDLL
jgi:hypothetical protein